jgi:hypothetical protein
MRSNFNITFYWNQEKEVYRTPIILQKHKLFKEIVLIREGTCDFWWSLTGYTYLNNTAAKLEAKGPILDVLHFRFFMVL